MTPERIATLRTIADIDGPGSYFGEALDALEASQANLAEERKPLQGHGEPCYYCGKPVNNLAGNPGLWSVELCHLDAPGRVKRHHVSCVSERLVRLEAVEAQLAAMRSALEKYGQHTHKCQRITRSCCLNHEFPCTCGLDNALGEAPNVDTNNP